MEDKNAIEQEIIALMTQRDNLKKEIEAYKNEINQVTDGKPSLREQMTSRLSTMEETIKTMSDYVDRINTFHNELLHPKEGQTKSQLEIANEAFLKLIPIDIYNKLTEECKLILNLPVIMTKLDFLHGALCQIHWLEGSSNTLKFPYQFFMSEDRVKDIDVKNLQEYFRSIEYLLEENLGYSPSNPDGENKFLYNDSIPAINTALDIFNESLEKRAEGGDIGGDEKLINEMRQWLAIKNDVKKRRENTSINLFQSFSEGSASGDIDDLGVAVGMYSQRCYYRGSISKNTDANKWVLSINEVICRFSDDFSFNDNLIDFGPIEYSQPLGCWINDIKKPEKPEKQKITDLKRVCLQNIDYQELKKELSKALPNSCNDFFIFSDFKSFKDEFIQKDIIIF